MLKNKNIILTSLGGAAIAAGVWYYFSRRNISVAQRYENLFKSYEKEFFLSAQIPLTTQIKFDQLFDLAVYDENDKTMIYNRLQYQGEDITNQGKCTNAINTGSIYYDCYDCSPIRQSIVKSHVLSESDEIYLVICEDCFDVSKHRGHKFEKVLEKSDSKFRCFCGDLNLMEEQSFCCSHQGFHKTREIAMKQKLEQPILWKGIEKFLLDSFYMVFNRMSDLLMIKNSGFTFNAKETDEIARLNIYLAQIIAKINEIIELNPPSIHNVAKIFQEKLQRPISLLQINRNDQAHKYNEKWIPVFSMQKRINNDISVYEYILIFYQFINDSNDTLLNKLFSTLNVVNESFNLFLIEKFIKYISLTIKENNLMQVSEGNILINEKAFPSFIIIIIEYSCLQKVFDHLIDSLGEDIFSPIDMLTKYLQQRPKLNIELDYVPYFLLNIAFSSFCFVNQIKKLLEKFSLQTIERFSNLQFVLFQTNSLEIQYHEQEKININLKLLKKQVDNMFSFNQLENTLNYSFFNMITAVLLINDEKLTQTIVSHLCSTFQRDVLKAREFIDSHEDTQFISLSLLFLTKLPIIIALSERQMFSKEIVNSFFSKKFSFTEKENQTKSYFFNSIQTVLNTFLYNQYQPNNLYELLSQAAYSYSELGNDLGDILSSQNNQYLSAVSKMYDLFTLTTSLLLLIDEKEYPENKSPCNLILSTCEHYIDDMISKKNDEYFIFYQYLYQKQIQQNILDPMPMINIFGRFSDLYFPKLNSSEDSQQCQLAQNIKQHMITIFSLFGEEINNDNELLYYFGSFLDQVSMFKKYINEIFLKQENEIEEGNQEQKPILKPEYVNKFYFRSFMKCEDQRIKEYLFIAQQKCVDGKHSRLEIDLNFDNLFQYQIDLYKKIYLNYEFQVKLKEKSLKEGKSNNLLAVYQHVYLTLQLIKEKNHPNLLTNEELEVISKIILLYKDQHYMLFYSTNQQGIKDTELITTLKYIYNMLHLICTEQQQQEQNQPKQQLEEQQQLSVEVQEQS